MIKSTKIPIFYPLQDKELAIQIEVKEGKIDRICSVVDNACLEFIKDSCGDFITQTENNINPSYLIYITRQINRMFGN